MLFKDIAIKDDPERVEGVKNGNDEVNICILYILVYISI
jgi:hypothetical protein